MSGDHVPGFMFTDKEIQVVEYFDDRLAWQMKSPPFICPDQLLENVTDEALVAETRQRNAQAQEARVKLRADVDRLLEYERTLRGLPELPLGTKVEIIGEEPPYWQRSTSAFPVKGSIGFVVHEPRMPSGRQYIEFRGNDKGLLIVDGGNSAYEVAGDYLRMFIPKNCFKAAQGES